MVRSALVANKHQVINGRQIDSGGLSTDLPPFREFVRSSDKQTYYDIKAGYCVQNGRHFPGDILNLDKFSWIKIIMFWFIFYWQQQFANDINQTDDDQVRTPGAPESIKRCHFISIRNPIGGDNTVVR